MNRAILILSIPVMFSNIAMAAVPAGNGNTDSGLQFWITKHQQNGESRSCASCHTNDPRQPGKHINTGKPIKPLSPSANPQSLSDPKKVEKWFRRNCKWTLGRECTPAEKADVLTFLKSI